MATRTLYFDESGFTGHNLLDASQPIFVLASSDIETDVAHEALARPFPRYRGREFKFSNLWRSNHKRGLVDFAHQFTSLDHHTFIWMIDKRFCVLTKIVDFLIEPYITETGHDFYADGFCWKYTNYIHFGLTQFAPPEILDRLLNAYQSFSRNPSRDALATLQLRLRQLAQEAEHPVEVFLEQMALGADLFDRYHHLDTFRGSDEIHVTSMLAVVTHWRKTFNDDFAIVHDASASFFRHRDIWERLTNEHVPPQPFPLGDGTTVEYPLRVISTTSVDSRECASVQFCDICAGLAAHHFDPRITAANRQLLNEVLEAGFSSLEYNGIRPEHVFPDQIPPRRRTGPDSVDRITNILFRQRE